MPYNDKNMKPGCCISWLYIKRYFGLEAAFPDLPGNGDILFKNIYRTASREKEVRSKKQEKRNIIKDTIFQAKFFTKIGIDGRRCKVGRYKAEGLKYKVLAPPYTLNLAFCFTIHSTPVLLLFPARLSSLPRIFEWMNHRPWRRWY